MPEPSIGSYLIDFTKEGCVSIKPDQTILQATLDSGIPIFHVCGGQGKCSTCRVLVVEGFSHLSSVNEKEQRLRTSLALNENVRLACQTKVISGQVKLQRIIRDEEDIHLYVVEHEGEALQQIGVEAEVAVLFMDIRNFTPYVASHLPFDIIHIIRKIFSVFHRIISSNNGVIIETAGDSIYAIFDDGKDMAQKCSSAVQSAFSMLESLSELNGSYFQKHFGEQIQIGIGIHAGQVIKGSIQMGEQEHMIVMGYPVNMAARLQNATKILNNSLVISEIVYEKLSVSSAEWKAATVQVQGVEYPLSVYLLGKPFY